MVVGYRAAPYTYSILASIPQNGFTKQAKVSSQYLQMSSSPRRAAGGDRLIAGNGGGDDDVEGGFVRGSHASSLASQTNSSPLRYE